MRYSIISYSFRRSFENGSMDIFDYIRFCQENGFTQLDPWMKHLEPGLTDRSWLEAVKAAGEATSLPFGCVAIDRGHIYEPTAEERAKGREIANAWLDVAEFLDASQVRIDTGGPDVMTDEMLGIIVEGYNELIPRARAKGLEVIVDNHWGPTKHPQNVLKVLEAVDGLGLLFDTNNWAEGKRELGVN